MLSRLKQFSERFNLAWPAILLFMLVSSYPDLLEKTFHTIIYWSLLATIALFFLYAALGFFNTENEDSQASH